MTIYQYRESLDRAIIDILYTEGPFSYRALKRKIDGYLEKDMSFDTFDLHMVTLLKRNIVKKKKIKNKVLYSLTQECRNKRDSGHDV